jgi:hypothetical protein
MRNRHEIEESIAELTPLLELAAEEYFSLVESKQKGEEVSEVDFIKTMSEYDILKLEIETLQWVLEPAAPIIIKQEIELIPLKKEIEE